MTDPPGLPEPRLAPRQRRALRTVDHVCEAAAQILETAGPAGFTTNHVAARAGYSIGTLYRYFPDKQALLALLARREVARQEARVEAALLAAPLGTTLEDLARIVVRAAVHPFEGRGRLRQAMLSMLPNAWLDAAARAALPMILPSLAAAAQRHTGRMLGEAGRLALLHVPIGAVAAAAREPALLADPAFEDAMVHLVAGCFSPA